MSLKTLFSSITLFFMMIPTLFAQQSDWVNYQRYEADNAKVTTRPKAVLFGDSITDFWASSRPDFFQTNNFIGRGISGQTTATILLRFQRDVVAHHPKYVTILCGVNDIAMNEHSVSREHILDNLIMMCDLAKANHIKPVLCTTTVPTQIGWRPSIQAAADQVRELNEQIRTYAHEHKIKLLDYAKVLGDENGITLKEYAGDGIHPNGKGYEIMEELLLNTLK